ncbi:rhodanese-like domain protein [Paraburkholderia xenovorans LB400]|uniref:Rhodanese-like domain protein n=1 Tax=Paraburkholderia xenovorans (strain LB400) TaxID=266265 RepID=Q13QQ8_PARXL|nr:rhodanese-like domain-containing protein [Paraburkholderia xenovorans]ABE33581.1 putative rhodanese-like domain protein [Paraburkholderia xenovorans LB400]AIP37045.1 rhodanese-like domain protein [Paraburkholderia xenovorans LB400]
MSHSTIPLITPAALRAALADRRELAILDVREEGVSARRRLFYSSIAAVGRLGLVVGQLVPRLTTPVVLVDEAGEYASRAAALLASFGYTHVSILEGGVSGWEAAGFEVFSGTNVPGKAFGEVIEHRLHTPNIDAPTLRQLQDAGEDLVVLDSRPFPEYQTMNIPGGVECAGAELVHRALAAAPSPDTLIVVNCAGRTRSILGAQSLVNAGIPNPVAALTGGSMSWLLSGFELERGRISTAPRPDGAALASARTLAQRAAARAGVVEIDRATLARFESEAATHTLYRFDVRAPLEYEAGHRAGWRSAPGGQLVQATDEYVGTLHARVVLADDDGVRARMTASWLVQLGYLQVFVLADDDSSAAFETGPEPLPIFRTRGRTQWIEADQLAQTLEAGSAQVVDVDSSLAFRRAHIAGARFVAASALEDLLERIDADASRQLVLTSSDGVLAGLLANQLRERREGVAALLGGTQRWLALGLPQASGDEGNLTGDDDAWYSPYHYAPAQAAQQMEAYLAWELQLVGQLERDGIASINVIDFDTPTHRRSEERLAALRRAN